MSRVSRWRFALRTWLRGAARERELDRELTDWVDELAARYQADGLPPEQARRRALIETGGIEQVKAHMRDVQRLPIVDGLAQDCSYACKSLIRAPGVLMAILVTLALGIGANTAVYSVIYSLLLQPPPYRAPQQLALIWANMGVAATPRARLAGPEVVDFQNAAVKFQSLAAIQSVSASLTGDGDAEQLRVGQVTWNFFDTLGVAAAAGRTFAPEDGRPAPAPPVVLSWDFFQRRFGGDGSVVGRRIVLDGKPVMVLGVLPQGFRLQFPADTSIPDQMHVFQPFPIDLARTNRLIRLYHLIGRVADGVTLEEAAAEVESISADLARRFPDYTAGNHRFFLVSLTADNTREVRPMLLALLGGVVVILLAACVNVAGLLLARAAARRREVATLVALGAGRARLTRQFVLEGLIIAALAVIAGLGTGVLALRTIVWLRPPGLDRLQYAEINTPVLVAITAIAAVWGLLFALAPLSEFAHLNVVAGLQNLSRVAGRIRSRTRITLVVTQIALGTALVVAAGLFVRTMHALHQVDAGFELNANALTFRLALNTAQYPTSAEANAFGRELEARLRALRGVEHVGAISHLPYDGGNLGSKYMSETQEQKLALARAADTRYVTPGVQAALGIQLLSGRWFTEDDDEDVGRVVVVDERLAARAWPGRDAVGQRIHLPFFLNRQVQTGWGTVIGVVRHVRHRTPDAELQEQVYLPYRQNLREPMGYVVRTRVDPASLAPEVRGVVASLDRSLPAYDTRPLASYVARAMSSRTFTAVLISSFAFIAVALAGVGLFGLIGYSVASRQREFGIRLAVGATPITVGWIVLREALALLSAGAVLGVCLAVAAANGMRALLFGVGPTDLASYLTAIVLLGLTGVAASWWPAHRAMRLDPVETLRSE